MRTYEVRDGVCLVELEEHEEAAFIAAAEEVWPLPDGAGDVELLARAARAAQDLDATAPAVVKYLRWIATHRGPKIVVFGLPNQGLDAIGPTPTSYAAAGQVAIHELDVWRALLVGAAGWYPYGFASQQSGALLNDVVSVPEFKDTQGHSGAARFELGLHTEDASYNLGDGLNISPDFLTLHYFRNPASIPTIVAWPQWEHLSQRTRSLLGEPWFVNATNPGQGGASNDAAVPVSVCFGPPDDPWFRINTARLGLDRYDGERRAALEELSDHLEQRRIAIAPEPGDVIIVDNARVAHGRPAAKAGQEPAFDGSDRWQRRLAVSNDPARIRAFESREHVVDPQRILRALGQAPYEEPAPLKVAVGE